MRKKPQYTWGDEIWVVENAPEPFRRNAFGVICGLTEQNGEGEIEQYYTVEYEDGKSDLIPERFLKQQIAPD